MLNINNIPKVATHQLDQTNDHQQKIRISQKKITKKKVLHISKNTLITNENSNENIDLRIT